MCSDEVSLDGFSGCGAAIDVALLVVVSPLALGRVRPFFFVRDPRFTFIHYGLHIPCQTCVKKVVEIILSLETFETLLAALEYGNYVDGTNTTLEGLLDDEWLGTRRGSGNQASASSAAPTTAAPGTAATATTTAARPTAASVASAGTLMQKGGKRGRVSMLFTTWPAAT
jgi:hypothetical protein